MLNIEKSQKYLRLDAIGMGPYAMKKIKVCQKCGMIAKKWTLLCPSCNCWLSSRTLFEEYKKMHVYCPKCGISLAKDAVFCPHCGRRISH